MKQATLDLTWRAATVPVEIGFAVEEHETLAEKERRRWAHFQYGNGRRGHQCSCTPARKSWGSKVQFDQS